MTDTPDSSQNQEPCITNTLTELKDLQKTAQEFGFDSLKDGSWFTKFLKICLQGYHERVIRRGGVEWLWDKYPGLPRDAIAQKLCELAEKTAALAGGVSGAAASSAILTSGAGIPLALTTIMAEVFFTVRLQLRLVYDLHLLYGLPINTSDPEDLIGLFAVVYGVKMTEAAGISIKAFSPEVARAMLYRLIHGNTKAIQAAVNKVLGPRIARKVTQKAILKTAVPVISTAISAGWNYSTTHLMGIRIRQDIRIKADLQEETKRLKTQIGLNESAEVAVLEGLIALALADSSFDDKERVVYMGFLRQVNIPLEDLRKLALKVNADLESVCEALANIQDPGNRESIARCFCLIASADGKIKDPESEVLNRLLTALRREDLLNDLPALCERFRSADGALTKALSSIGSATLRTSNQLRSSFEWIYQKSQIGMDEAGSLPNSISFDSSAEEESTVSILRDVNKLEQLMASGHLDQQVYERRWGELVQKLNK